ncbi:NRG2 protein, partial [Polypterus senegalus]
MRLDPVHFSMLVIGVSFACYSPSLNSLQDQAFRSAVVIEGKVQSVASNVTKEPHSVNVKVLDVWPLNSGGLQRNQLVTIGDFGSEAPCVKVKKNHKYIFFMAPTDEHLVFKASFAPVDTSGKNLKKDVGRILCEDCGAAPQLNRFENITVREGEKLTLKCEATGNPIPEFKWFRDGKKLKKSKEIRIRHGRVQQEHCMYCRSAIFSRTFSHPCQLFLFAEAEELYQKRVLTITGICVALLVVGIVCVVAYCKTKHEDRTWSLDRTDSIISDSHSGIMSSSVGTSKCNSPACIEARTRRAAHCGIIEPRRAMMHYRDSIDSLRDSPHSDRYVSALTTPARLSPVDFHYSLPTQVPTFEITSPNSSHAVSLPPAAAMTYHMEEEQPLLRQYQVPLQDVQRHDPYYQRRSYLNDSTGSLPSSPFRMVEDDEYETTQEYLSALEQPKKTASSSKRWRKSKVNGHISQRRDIIRDFSSQSCMSISDSEEEQAGESTPFLSMQNMNMTANAEPSTVYRPGDNRTYYSFNRHTARGNLQTRITHTRSKQDSAPL